MIGGLALMPTPALTLMLTIGGKKVGETRNNTSNNNNTSSNHNNNKTPTGKKNRATS